MRNSDKKGYYFWWKSLTNSYSQIFFSENELLGMLCIIVTFLNPTIGILAMLGVISGNILAYFFTHQTLEIEKGIWGFNHLLVSLFISNPYDINTSFILLFISANIMCFITTFWIKNWTAKSGMPFLTIPFIITVFASQSSQSMFPGLEYNDSGIYLLNEKLKENLNPFWDIDDFILSLQLPDFILGYFRTLSNIYFSKFISAGIILSIGIIIFSRITFLFTIIAFAFAYKMFQLYGIETQILATNLLGANFIFFAIAICCYFFVPGKIPVIYTFIFFPVMLLIAMFLTKILAVFQLSPLNLPFIICTIAALSVARYVKPIKGLLWVKFQHSQPEKNLYLHHVISSIQERINKINFILPFYGKWIVSQGYSGNITHLGPWSKALDFILLDDEMKSYKNPGLDVEDYYCFGKPVIAPASGYVVSLINDVDDNLIGLSNTKQNWGNSIVIQHTEGIYSQLSHLKKFSSKVSIGEYVQQGQIIAQTGSSGRSPEPHLHFQVQKFALIGSHTLEYPISNYIAETLSKKELHQFEIPKEGQLIYNPLAEKGYIESFMLLPGFGIKLADENDEIFEWKVFTTAYNESYLYCSKTFSLAYFVLDNSGIQFTTFEGDKSSLLYYFFICNYKVSFFTEEGIISFSNIASLFLKSNYVTWIFDFFAPFVKVRGAEYESQNKNFETHFLTFSTCRYKIGSFVVLNIESTIKIENNKLSEWIISQNRKIKKIRFLN